MNEWTTILLQWFARLLRVPLHPLRLLLSLFCNLAWIPMGPPCCSKVQRAPQNGVHDQQDTKYPERILVFLEWFFIAAMLLALIVCGIEWYVHGVARLGATGWTAAFAGVLILATLQQALYARRQWEAMGQQLDHLRLEQRAWLVYTKIDEPNPQTGFPLSTKLFVTNTGLTPGFIYRKLARVIERNRHAVDLSEDARAVEQEMRERGDDVEIVIAPGEEPHALPQVHKECEITLELNERIDHRKAQGNALFLFGMICYRDAIGREHASMCCYRYSPKENKFIRHRRHNYLT